MISHDPFHILRSYCPEYSTVPQQIFPAYGSGKYRVWFCMFTCILSVSSSNTVQSDSY